MRFNPPLMAFISEHNFSGWTHCPWQSIWHDGVHTASINFLFTKQTVGIQTETEPKSGSFPLRKPKRTQTNQGVTEVRDLLISNKVLSSSGILYSLLQFVSLRCIWFETWNNSSNKPTPTSTMHRTPTNYMRELMVLMVGWRSGSLKMLLKLFPLR